VVQQRHERGVVGDDALGVLADDRRLHAVVEQLGGGAAHRGEGVDVQIPTQAGRVFRDEAGQCSGMKPATVPI
jgi:hypothetical protein